MNLRNQILFGFFISALLNHQVSSFGLLNRVQYTTQPLNIKNRQQDELRLVTDLFVDSFWQGKVGGGTKQLTEAQSRTLQAQQYSEFRRRYSRGLNTQLLVCKDTRNNNIPIGCAGVEVDTVAIFSDEYRQPPLTGFLASLTGNNIPEKPTGRWDTKMIYAPVMSNLVVSRDYRGKGIAQQIVAEVEDLCQEWGYDECYLYVEKRNIPAVKLYQKMGYKTLWQDEQAKTLLPTTAGDLESAPTVILCMKKILTAKAKKKISLWPF
jgi:ribosomal protein S18 acetylase RimI-like enzyme